MASNYGFREPADVDLALGKREQIFHCHISGMFYSKIKKLLFQTPR